MEIDKLEENNIEQNQEQEQKRPTFLLVLCILSFISLGFNFIGNFFGLFSGPLSESELEKVMSESLKMVAALQETGNNEISETLELVVNMQGYINGNFYFHSLITLLSVITGFIGVLLHHLQYYFDFTYLC